MDPLKLPFQLYPTHSTLPLTKVLLNLCCYLQKDLKLQLIEKQLLRRLNRKTQNKRVDVGCWVAGAAHPPPPINKFENAVLAAQVLWCLFRSILT